MAALTYNQITEAVLKLMDEHGGDPSFMPNDDTTTEMKSIIRQVTEGSVRSIHLKAPIAMLDASQGPLNTCTVTESNGRYVYLMPVPSDFLRMVRCRVDSWSRPVTHLWWEDSAEYAKQKNPYLMGTPANPAAFLIHHLGTRYVEMYSTEDNSKQLLEFLYAATPAWSGSSTNPSITVSDMLKTACLEQIAADTLDVLGETDRAQRMQMMALRRLNTFGGNEREFADNGNRVEKL